jgi:hypothetical protein
VDYVGQLGVHAFLRAWRRGERVGPRLFMRVFVESGSRWRRRVTRGTGFRVALV